MDEHTITYLQYFTGTDGHQRAVCRVKGEWALYRQIAKAETFLDLMTIPWERQAIAKGEHGRTS